MTVRLEDRDEPTVYLAVTPGSCTPRTVPFTLSEGFQRCIKHAHDHDAAMVGQPWAQYLSWTDNRVELIAAVPLDKPVPDGADVRGLELPAGPALVAVYQGPYEQISEAHRSLEAELRRRGYDPGPMPFWEVYVSDPSEEPDPEQWRTDVICRLRS